MELTTKTSPGNLQMLQVQQKTTKNQKAQSKPVTVSPVSTKENTETEVTHHTILYCRTLYHVFVLSEFHGTIF